MGIKDIVISMLTVTVLVFLLYKPYRKREKKRNELEVLYYEALRNQSQNVEELGMNYYQALGLSADASKTSIQNDRNA